MWRSRRQECRLQLKRRLVLYRHHHFFHEMVSYRSSRAENLTDLRFVQGASFVVQKNIKTSKEIKIIQYIIYIRKHLRICIYVRIFDKLI